MLSCAGFRNDALLAHALCEQGLAKAVVDLVRARVIQIFALQIDLAAIPGRREPFGVIQGRWPARIIVEEIFELRMKRWIA